MQDDWFLVKADGGVLRVVRLFVQFENVLHGGDKLGAYFWKAPLLVRRAAVADDELGVLRFAVVGGGHIARQRAGGRTSR
jgi:hypothetical protein